MLAVVHTFEKLAAGISMTSISEADYCAIEDALQSTEKGRRFLRAYADRSRTFETRGLLRSISRLHRATFGQPGLNAEVCRDLVSVLRSVAGRRRAAGECGDPSARSDLLASGLQEVEACLIALIESIEERTFESIGNGFLGTRAATAGERRAPAASAQFFGEIPSYFPNEPR